MLKEKYEVPKLEIIVFESEDIIITSNGDDLKIEEEEWNWVLPELL